MKLDRVRMSIRSSPRYGLSPPDRLTKEQCWTVPPCSYVHGRPVLHTGPRPNAKAMNLSNQDAVILKMMQQVGWGGGPHDFSVSPIPLGTNIQVGFELG